GTGLPARGIMHDEPPGRAPGHPGEDAAVHRSETRTASDGPGHRAQGRKEQAGQHQVMGQIISTTVVHAGSASAGAFPVSLYFSLSPFALASTNSGGWLVGSWIVVDGLIRLRTLLDLGVADRTQQLVTGQV